MTRLARRGIVAAALLAGAAWSGAMAQGVVPESPDRGVQDRGQDQASPAPAAEDGRYSFHRMGEGFVRLDSRTGQLSQCGWAATGWACKPTPDERTALDSEIDRLRRENAALKKSLLTRGIELPNGVIAEAPQQSAPAPPENVPDTSRGKDPKGPSDAELDRAIAFVKNVWRRLVDLMTDLQRDIQKKS
jgi:hypothetical protein